MARCLPLYTEAIACTEQSGDHITNAALHNNAGLDALIAGDIPAARAHLEAAVKAGQQIGSEHAFESLNLGMMLGAEGNLEGPRSTVDAALRGSRRNGDNRSMAGACLHLACLAGDAGDWDRAASCTHRAGL